ncbi:hypothetical protein F8O01_14845 [Pseudoclavibacter chungangensis]|uniref:Uncharacterized protein n=1 Tax=Pseudoclavibacter chungangensis TaxID=587635 RepID=A0A7J5BNK9_9MICO|nr:hypothetical protein [Pseudoclavibacter chungangensis]KAB1653620.1 hypothetical protein F8O01_14845 [Pseudoclavibacter chungangensis]NYJ68727.1 hypothetical protein [Pseudoclavibacter chungangensis]
MTIPGTPQVRLDELLVTVPGVVAVYPQAGVRAVVASVTWLAATVTGRDVREEDAVTRSPEAVSATIATSRGARSPDVARAAADALLAAAPSERVKLRVARIT